MSGEARPVAPVCAAAFLVDRRRLAAIVRGLPTAAEELPGFPCEEGNVVRAWVLVAGPLAALACCVDRPGDATHGRSGAPATRTPTELGKIRALNRLANDRRAARADRAKAVFALFKHHLQPGDGLQRVRDVLRDPGWVRESKLYYFAILAGWIPVDLNDNDRTYSLHLFPDAEGHSDWVIYLQLAGQSEFGQWDEDGVAFLQGKVGSRGESRLKEYALDYPDGRFERFRRR